MRNIVECVSNFSEGRDPVIVRSLMTAVTSVPGVWLLDHTMDEDHHRSVLTFAGRPEGVGEAAFRAIQVATERIDLRRHEGVHPRVGATDVVPFVPLEGVPMEECVQLARFVAQRVGSELGIPVFLYEQASSRHEPRRLESIRLGGLQGLASRMKSDPEWLPDFGPPRLHKTAGAIVIGARRPLVAFNVNLRTKDLSVAKAIAETIRESTGGLPFLKAIGVELASRGLVQVAMNLTDYKVTSIPTAFQAVKIEAENHGVDIAGSELIGLIPQAAIGEASIDSLEFERFDPSQILETRLAQVMSRNLESDMSLSGFLDAVAAAKPTPAGGSVAALVGALAASLGVLGARLGDQREREQRLLELSRQLHLLVQDDVEAYEGLSAAYKIPKQNPDRARAISVALHEATEVPLEIAELACEAGRLIDVARKAAKPPVHSDLTVGLIMAIAAAEAGLHTARENNNHQLNQHLKESLIQKIAKSARSLEELRGLCYTPPPRK